MSLKKNNGEKAFDFINIIFMLIVMISTLYPFLYILIVSISPIEDVMKEGFILPSRIDFSSYKFAFATGAIQRAYGNTIFVVVVGTSLNILFTLLGGYVLSKKKLPGVKVMNLFVIITMLFNGGLIPFYIVVRSLNLVNTIWSLIIPVLINTYNLIIMRSFIQSIPESLEESAQIDGCSYTRMLFNIIAPLSMPVLATLTLFYAVGHWNAFFNAIIFINRKALWPLQVVVREIFANNIEAINLEDMPPPSETMKMATVIICTVPILVVYPFLQKYFVKGVMLGAVKG